MNEPPEQPELVILQVPEPDGVLQEGMELTTQHCSSTGPGQYPGMNEPPEQPELVILQVPEPDGVLQEGMETQHSTVEGPGQ
jgi:hypothetical protein